jgi:hypothetical protein
MKSLFSALFLLLGTSLTFASNVELVVEKVDNGGVVAGNTYRVYAVLTQPQHSIHAIFGEGGDFLAVESTGAFYQHPLGGYSSIDVNPNVVNLDPALAFDTWVTIGAENAVANNLWTIGIEFGDFENGGSISADNGAWFLVPTDVRTLPDATSKILLMQLTTTGTATGTLNFQGWDQEGMPWQERGLTFTTSEAHVFGCMQQGASNFNVDATYDDGSCVLPEAPAVTPQPNQTNNGSATVGKLDGVLIFPNPIWEGQFNLQFANRIELVNEMLIVEIFDGAGKKVYGSEFGNEAIVGGNRIVIKHDLAAGTYTVSTRTSTFSTSSQIVVTR